MMRRTVMLTATLLTLGAGFAHAAIPNTTDYLHRTAPMITGTVVSVDDLQIVVDTDQGRRVTLVMDSRTMLPVDLAVGMVMRAEFRVMENGQYYVNRITPIRDAASKGQSEAYWKDRGHEMKLARASEIRPHEDPAASGPSAAVEQPAQPVAAGEPMMAADASTASGAPKTLPQTASTLPLIALLGLLALGGAGILMLKRRLATA